MALNDESSGGIPATMLVGPTNVGGGYPVYGGNGGGIFGGNGDGGWWIVLLIIVIAALGGGWGNNNGNGFGNQPVIINDGGNGVQRGFDQAAVMAGVNGITAGISGLSTQLCGCCGDISTQLCNGFNGVNATINGGVNALQAQMYNNTLADLERSFAAQTASTAGFNALQNQLAQCCCDNRAATQDVKYTIATEACATRATSTANTQAILDKLCQLELDGYKRENDQLRSQLQFANLQASQVAQTAEIRTNNATVANQLVSELRSCPIPAQPVYGNQPIFTCGGGCGCAA